MTCREKTFELKKAPQIILRAISHHGCDQVSSGHLAISFCRLVSASHNSHLELVWLYGKNSLGRRFYILQTFLPSFQIDLFLPLR